ncbi:membrane hypothetical protein [uncultured Desulfobacterium sp.]|uniref:Small multi-drug export protein n=1 Tax=uncultured Desulfobacterium sp. TaxID=201089 RepID=A0A445MWU5_9BACT|nr:membrane hypothetical protein [uncultured Desulfobacterium sp.]
MSFLSQGGIVITAYLAAGRLGAIAACLIMGLSPWHSLFISLIIDLFQIPVYGLALESAKRRINLPGRFTTWIKTKADRVRTGILEKESWKGVLRYRHVAIVLVATLPFRGFGVLSACILAVMLGYGRVVGTSLIMSGSLIGSAIAVCMILFPGRYFGVL